MRGTRFVRGGKGFTLGELIFLMVILAAFLAGTVWLVDQGVRTFSPSGKEAKQGTGAQNLLDRLEALTKDARVFLLPAGAERAKFETGGAVEFLSNIDGDTSTGSYEAAGQKGLERVTVRRDTTGRGLVAEVSEAPGEPSKTVELTDDLDTLTPAPFKVEYLDEAKKSIAAVRAGDRVYGLEVSVALSEQRGDEAVSRSIGLTYAPVVVSDR
jgi:hypothetical protein